MRARMRPHFFKTNWSAAGPRTRPVASGDVDANRCSDSAALAIVMIGGAIAIAPLARVFRVHFTFHSSLWSGPENLLFDIPRSMNLTFGTLEFKPVSEHPELLAPPVVAALRCSLGEPAVGVSEIDPSLADTATFCERYNVGPGISANCVVLQAKRGEKVWFAACVVLATTRADVNGAVRQILQARKVSFASMQEAVSLTGMEYGGITPIGLPADWPLLIDKAVAEIDWVIVGSGMRKSKVAISGGFLAQLPNARIVEGLGRLKSDLPIRSAQ
jgi:prolyl-tRNA editing enzyme YbaK/EbsC (Cys-tRNA(Pro) deacylase)